MLKQIRFLQSWKNRETKKALLICFPRTGSTSLSSCFRSHPEIRFAGEVFNRTNPNFSSIVHSVNDFQKNVYNQYNVFQIKYTSLGMDNFSDLLKRKEYIIQVLYRKNSFEQTISTLIAQELKEWNSVEKLFELEPFELEYRKFQNRISKYKNDLESLKRVLVESKQQFRVIAYEDIFSPAVDISIRVNIFFDLLTYFGFDAEKLKEPKIIELLSENRKINNISSYSYVKNYEELKESFGNEFISWENV